MNLLKNFIYGIEEAFHFERKFFYSKHFVWKYLWHSFSFFCCWKITLQNASPMKYETLSKNDSKEYVIRVCCMLQRRCEKNDKISFYNGSPVHATNGKHWRIFRAKKKKTLQHYILEQLKIFDKNPNDTIDTITGIVMILLFIYPRGVYLLIHGTHFRRIFVIIIYKSVDKMCVCAARTSSNRKYRSYRKSISTPSPAYGEDCDWRRRRWRRISHIHMSSYWRWCKNTIKWNKNHNNTNKCQIEQW